MAPHERRGDGATTVGAITPEVLSLDGVDSELVADPEDDPSFLLCRAGGDRTSPKCDCKAQGLEQLEQLLPVLRRQLATFKLCEQVRATRADYLAARDRLYDTLVELLRVATDNGDAAKVDWARQQLEPLHMKINGVTVPYYTRAGADDESPTVGRPKESKAYFRRELTNLLLQAGFPTAEIKVRLHAEGLPDDQIAQDVRDKIKPSSVRYAKRLGIAYNLFDHVAPQYAADPKEIATLRRKERADKLSQRHK